MANQMKAQTKTFFRPIRSAIFPNSSRKEPDVRVYAASNQVTEDPVAPKLSPIWVRPICNAPILIECIAGAAVNAINARISCVVDA